MLLLEPVNSIISYLSSPPPSKKKEKNHTSLSFRLTSFVLMFFWVWVRKSEQGLMLCAPVVDMKQTCGSNRPAWQLSGCGCAVILECECQMRRREKGDHCTAHPTWQPASLRLHGRTEGGNSHMHVQIESAVSRFTFLFFLTHPFILDSCEESHMMPSFNLSSKEFLAH